MSKTMRLQQKNFSPATGFTLVELLFTIASAAIIGGGRSHHSVQRSQPFSEQRCG